MKERVISVAFLMVTGLAIGSSNDVDMPDPFSIVKETTTKMLVVIDERREAFEENPRKLRSEVKRIIAPNVDFNYLAQLILYGVSVDVTKEQMNDFSRVMSEVAINRFAGSLLAFRSDQQVKILPIKGRDSDRLTRVRTRVLLENGGFASINYIFHKTELGWKAFDVTIDGVSYIQTYRQQIIPRVESVGIEMVMKELSGNMDIKE